MNWLEYGYKADKLYHYSNHHWSEINRAEIYTKIRNDLNKFLKCNDNIINRFIKSNLKLDYIYLDFIEYLSNNNNIYHLDTNPYTMGCENGVIEIRKSKAFFRPGKPEDFISISTGINYPENYTWEHPNVKKLLDYYNEIHIHDIVEKRIKLDSSYLNENNRNEFTIWCGGDSKDLIKEAYGSYYFDIKSLPKFTDDSPFKFLPRTARVIILSEYHKLDDCIIKEIVGRDR